MAYRKKTLRTMSPTARKVARLTGELESVTRRFKNLVPDLQQLDLDSEALKTARQYNYEAVRHKLCGIKSIASVEYKEIHNVESINHSLEVIANYAKGALEVLS